LICCSHLRRPYHNWIAAGKKNLTQEEQRMQLLLETIMGSKSLSLKEKNFNFRPIGTSKIIFFSLHEKKIPATILISHISVL